MRRGLEGSRRDYGIAGGRGGALGESLSEMFRFSTGSRELQILLRQLESSAQSYRSFYDPLPQRYHLAVQQQSFSIPAARVISSAYPPVSPSWPKTVPFVGAGLVAGLMLGACT